MSSIIGHTLAMLWLCHRDVLDYLLQGSRDSGDIVKWRIPPTVGDMWSQPSEYLVCVSVVCVCVCVCGIANSYFF